MSYVSPSTINWSRGLPEVFRYINTEATGGLFGWLFLLCIYIIFAFGVHNYKKDITMSLAVAGFITTIIATLFRIADVINTLTLSMVVVITVISVLIFLFSKR